MYQLIPMISAFIVLFAMFFFPNEATFPLVRKDYYKKTVHGAYIQTGKSPSEQVQKNEISYLA